MRFIYFIYPLLKEMLNFILFISVLILTFILVPLLSSHLDVFDVLYLCQWSYRYHYECFYWYFYQMWSLGKVIQWFHSFQIMLLIHSPSFINKISNAKATGYIYSNLKYTKLYNYQFFLRHSSQMCLIFFCNLPSQHSQIKFILGFNRQQQTLRQTLRFNHFSQDPNIYGGRDLKSGGTWLGLNIKTGLLVFLTNYDLPPPNVFRPGRSRGQLVYKFLSTNFVPSSSNHETIDKLVFDTLQHVASQGKQYSAFNLTVYNMRSGKLFYMCSEWEQNNPTILQQKVSYGLCNNDINTIYPKTAHGMAPFKQVVEEIDSLKNQEILERLRAIFKDKKRFSQIDDDESSIFVQPYWCTLQKAERMTKSTFLLLVVEHQGKIQLMAKQVTYDRTQGSQSEVNLLLTLVE